MYVKIGDELHGGEPSVEKAAGDCKRFRAVRAIPRPGRASP
jgi:hypothetical protein